MAIVTKPLLIQLSNGSTADATQVMSLLNTIADSVNTNAAPLASPSFTGTVAGASATFTGTVTSGNTLTAAAIVSNGDTQTSSINGGQLAGMRNRIINGNFAINQRSVSGTVTLAAGVYGHDRWKAGAGGCTYTFAVSGADTIITVTAGSLMQIIEGANIEGGVYRLSQQGTAQARIAVNGAATSGAYAANPQSSASATGGQNVTIEFTTGTIDRVMFEPGTTASTFERRQIGYEINACARYLPVYNYGSASGAAPLASAFANSSVLAVIPLIFQVPARVPPTGFGVSSFGNFQFSGPGAAYTISGMSLIGSSIYGVQINATISGATAGTGGQFQIITPTAFILFNGCEL